jgi:glutamyl-tRNA synthetase
LYDAALAQLRAAEKIYPCTCTRSDVAAAASAPHVGQEGPAYPGTCAHRRAADTASVAQPYCWRFRTEDKVFSIQDRFMGERRLNIARELGDFVVAKADGAPAYQLAVVVDDYAMGISEVLRGDDLLPSAFRQLALYEFFGWTPPTFAHVPLVVGTDGRRLAKRHGDTRLSALREEGVKPERLVGLLAWSCGWLDQPRAVTPRNLLSHFTLSTVPPEPFVFSAERLAELLSAAD